MSFKQQTHFKYDPLDRESNTIRLLLLEPSEEGQPIRCTMWHHSLNDLSAGRQKVYTALSYTWGSLEPEKSRRWIRLNGKPFHVQPNLFAALRAVDALTKRNLLVSRVLWVDAVCIDQSNFNERNHQVGLMGKIYGGAAHVLAWLGESTESSRAVFRWISAIHDFHEDPPYTDEIENALLELCRRDYWTRAWIQQEIFLANFNAIIMCGRDDATWAQFFLVCTGSDRMRTATTQTSAGLLLQGGPSSKLGELIDRGMVRLNCSDVRDRIFSLLSMASDIKDDEEKRKADYFVAPDLLFMSVMGVCKPQNVNILATPLALMLQARIVDLLELVSGRVSNRDAADTKLGCCDKGENASIWAIAGQQYLAMMRESRSAIECNPFHSILEPGSTTRDEVGQSPQLISSDGKTRVVSSVVLPDDFVYGIVGTDAALVSRRSPFGSFVAGFLRKNDQAQWRDYVPGDVPGAEAVKQAVLKVLKTTRDVENGEAAARKPGHVYGLKPPVQEALESGRDVNVFLGALEALRAEGQLCLQTCIMTFEPLFGRNFTGPWKVETGGRV